MASTVADTIRTITREHLTKHNGLLFGQCVTAVGWIGGTVPELSEEKGIVELSIADVANAGIAVGAALMGRRPIYVIRYQGFMWYNAAPLLNYAAKSKDMWKIPCPLFVRAIAMEGGIGPSSTGCHHGMVIRMPGMPVVAPMTPKEWQAAWEWFLAHDNPLYVSEHRRSFPIHEELAHRLNERADITILAISAARLNALEAVDLLARDGIVCDLVHVVWLKPFTVTDIMLESLARTRVGLVVDSDFAIAGAARSIAYELMWRAKVPVYAMGLDDRTAGFAPQLDNVTPTGPRIAETVRQLLDTKAHCQLSCETPP
ncbi:MAG: transketolase C-terminal domain-containing protein [Nitrospirota bacterium]